MSHQGNIYLSFNLVLLVRVAPEFGDSTISEIQECIDNQMIEHLENRFNKCAKKDDRDKKVSRWILDMYRKRVQVEWLTPSRLNLIRTHSKSAKAWICRRIKKRDKQQIGHIRVWLYWEPSKEISKAEAKDLEYSIEVALRDVDPEVRVEPFHIGRENPPKGKQNPKAAEPKEKDVYHLSSRVCAAFVEYVAAFVPKAKPNDKRCSIEILAPFLLNNDCACALRSIDPMQCERRADQKPLDPHRLVKKILDVRDAFDLVCSGLDGSMRYFPPVPYHMQNIFEGKDNRNSSVYCRYKFPFGVWFRGQARVCYGLVPSLFREDQRQVLHPNCSKIPPTNTMYDESSMIHHFMLHEPRFQQQFRNPFEWICLMQHYDAPSRVLDWSENILMALFFAVWETDVDCDGAIWVLNAGRMNEITRVSESRRYVCLPGSVDVVLRSAMAISRTASDLKTVLRKYRNLESVLESIDKEDKNFKKWLDGKCYGYESSVWRRLAYPVAVFPGRANDRLANQQATFTLHGGKTYDPEIAAPHLKSRLPPTCGLVEISHALVNKGKTSDGMNLPCIPPEAKQFLDVYVVPSCAKRKIREQLKRLGVHVASAFPELEYQSKYIRHQWRFESRDSTIANSLRSKWVGSLK